MVQSVTRAATETSPEASEQLAAFVRMGQPPDEVAEKVMRGIMENELFVFTHPELRNWVEDRFQRILSAYPAPCAGLIARASP